MGMLCEGTDMGGTISKDSSNLWRPVLGLLLVMSCSAAVVQPLRAAPARKVVTSQNDLPRFTYAVDGTATALLTADDATFGAFAARVRRDVDTMLDTYDIRDHATLRELFGVRLALQALSGENQAALDTVARIRALQDKPDARLLSGLRMQAVLKARIQTGKDSGPAYEQAFESLYAASIKDLPWAVVGTGIKETKSSAQIISKGLLLGEVRASIEPAVAKLHQVDNEMAWTLINVREEIRDVLPLKPALIRVLARDVTANNVRKPDIWAEREVVLTPADKLTPVRVAIWDSGSDLALFPGQVYTDPDPAPQFDPHGLAFDLQARPTHGELYPLSDARKQQYQTELGYLKGLSDLQQSIDSPEADQLKAKLSSLSPGQVSTFLETLEFFSNYVHGTHVAGLAAAGNPAIRLAVARITFDWHNVPLAPSDALERRSVAAYRTYVAWFRAHHVRVVNMSWGGTPQDYETALARNGIGKTAEQRKTLARHYYDMDRAGLLEALKSAPQILFVCAAGNANSDSGFDEEVPASFDLPNLLVVGAVDQAGDEASFTSYGKTVKVDADGYQVLSTVPGGRKIQLSGTSMASPNTVNLAAKLLALDPALTPEQVIGLIVKGATPSADGRRHNIDEKRSVAALNALRGG
jgi:hypothetical protein